MLQWHTLSTVNLQALCAESINGNKTDSFLVLVNSDLVQNGHRFHLIIIDNYLGLDDVHPNLIVPVSVFFLCDVCFKALFRIFHLY